MKIYTKTGDEGETSLFGGKRVKKYHPNIQAYGTIDELNSWIGLVKDLLPQDTAEAILIDIQENTLNDGTVTFDFTDSYKEGQAGFAVLDIQVNGSFKGVIMIEEMKTNKKTVYL